MLSDPSQMQLCALIRAHRSLGGAAAELGVTPAAVTAQLARAEREWRARLVDRGPRGAQLTSLGEVLADAGEAILTAAEAAQQQFAERVGRAAGRLRIGTFQTVAEHLLPAAVTALRHRRPGVELSIVETTSTVAVDQLIRRALDVVVLADYGETAGRPAHGVRGPRPGVWTQMLVDPLVMCLPDDHQLARRARNGRGISLSSLRHEAWIVVSSGQPARAQFDQAAAQAGFVPRVQFETDNYSTAQALVGTGIGVAAISRLTVRSTPGATHLPLARPRLSRHLSAVTLQDSPAAELAQEFIGLLVDAARELRSSWDEPQTC